MSLRVWGLSRPCQNSAARVVGDGHGMKDMLGMMMWTLDLVGIGLYVNYVAEEQSSDFISHLFYPLDR